MKNTLSELIQRLINPGENGNELAYLTFAKHSKPSKKHKNRIAPIADLKFTFFLNFPSSSLIAEAVPLKDINKRNPVNPTQPATPISKMFFIIFLYKTFPQ